MTDNIKNAELRKKLEEHQYTPEEYTVMRSAMFNFITLTSVGAASIGLAARLIAKSRRVPTGFFTFTGTLLGLGCGASLGTDRALHKMRTSLPPDSLLLEFITQNKKLNSGKMVQNRADDVENTAVVTNDTSNTKSEVFLYDDTKPLAADSASKE